MKLASVAISEAFLTADYELAVAALADHYGLVLPDGYDFAVMLDRDHHPEVVIETECMVYGWDKIIGLYSGRIVTRDKLLVTVFDCDR
jgi:hypothetical protein